MADLFRVSHVLRHLVRECSQAFLRILRRNHFGSKLPHPIQPSHLNSQGFAVLCVVVRSEEHTSELQSLMRISYAVFCLQKKTIITDKLSDRKPCHNTLYTEITTNKIDYD